MKITSKFNKGILNMINMHSYFMYYIERNLNVKCACVSHETSQANPECPKCLGTGYKITIRKFKGAAQDSIIPPTSFRTDNIILARSFYIPSDITIKEEDLIIDNGMPYLLFKIQELIGLEGTIPYRKSSGVKKKYDTDIFLKNFNAIINAKR